MKKTTVSYLEFRHHQSIEEYTRDKSELVNQDDRIVWASFTSSLEVARYDYLPHHFSLMFQPPLFHVKIKKKSHFEPVFEPVIS